MQGEVAEIHLKIERIVKEPARGRSLCQVQNSVLPGFQQHLGYGLRCKKETAEAAVKDLDHFFLLNNPTTPSVTQANMPQDLYRESVEVALCCQHRDSESHRLTSQRDLMHPNTWIVCLDSQ
jgi:hypothetical protein